MNFKPRLFYDAGANEGGGAAAEVIDKGGEQQQQEQQQEQQVEKEAPKEIPKQVVTDEQLKTWGFDTLDNFNAFMEKHKESSVPDEVKREKENLEKANFIKFSTEQKLLNVDEYTQYENIKAKSDKDLVFEKYLEEYKTDHPDITDPQDLQQAAQEDFEAEYKLNDSEASKKKGEAKLARDAKEIRSPFESKVLAAQDEFKEYSNVQQTYPKFKKFITESIERNVPEKLSVGKLKEGENEFDVEIELKKEAREEMIAAISKTFDNPKTFARFNELKPEEAKTYIDNKINGWLIQNQKQEIVNRSYEIGKGVGMKSGSNIGANNPFALQQGAGAGQVNAGETLEESNARIAKERQNARQHNS